MRVRVKEHETREAVIYLLNEAQQQLSDMCSRATNTDQLNTIEFWKLVGRVKGLKEALWD